MNNTNNTIFVLDAGGTGFKFNAVRDARQIIDTFTIPSAADSLDEVLHKIIQGFRMTEERCGCRPRAISFSFPGPADYRNGIIGDLGNLPTFRGGVALKPMLEEVFQVPVFINNDGDLFAYGEALGGFLPEVNKMLERQGNPKRYQNLIGVTLGTGFGGGIVLNGVLLDGDNSAGGEIWCTRNSLYPSSNAEDSVTIRAVRRVYAREAHIPFDQAPEPADLFEIAMGRKEGDKAAALKAWDELAIVLADILANTVTLIDGLIVIGGGLSGAWPVFMPTLIEKMRQPFTDLNGNSFARTELQVFNMQDHDDQIRFTEKTGKMVKVPFSDKEVWYDASKRTGIGVTCLGTSAAVAIGAYAFAMHELEGK